MSGPKRAEVEAKLRDVEAARHKAESLIASSESRALRSLVTNLEGATRDLPSTASVASDLAGSRDDVASVRDAKTALTQANSAQAEAKSAVDAARRQVSEADDAGKRAEQAFRGAKDNADRAQALLTRNSSDHYKHEEMRLAQEAERGFASATRLGKAATRARTEARRAVNEALDCTRRAHAVTDQVVHRAKAAAAESAERTRAEEEAKRIAEEARRRASVAVRSARAALGALHEADCQKFAGSQREELMRNVDDAESRFKAGESAVAQQIAEKASARAGALAAEVAAARIEFDRRQTAARTAVDELTATLDAVDADLIAQWADDPTACDRGRDILAQVREHLAAERFEQAASGGAEAAEGLRIAMTTAAQAQAAHERRASIGEAIMDVLEEMNFQVFETPGTKHDPLKIVGQVPGDRAIGDFELEIPLDGEVDFEVKPKGEGDGSCSAVVKDLQQRLAARGVGFNVTDWGYGHDPSTDPRGTCETFTEIVTETVTYTESS